MTSPTQFFFAAWGYFWRFAQKRQFYLPHGKDHDQKRIKDPLLGQCSPKHPYGAPSRPWDFAHSARTAIVCCRAHHTVSG